MSKNDDSTGFLFVIGIVVVLGVGYGVYTVLKGWADAVGLDVHSIFWLVVGTAVVVITPLVSWMRGWRHAIVLPWLLPTYWLFWLPAMTYWATPKMGPFGRYGDDADIDWYGNGWWQALILVGLCGVAFALMKWLDDDYR